MEENGHNEMNLFDLICLFCRSIGRFFKWCGVSLLHLVRFSVQNIWIILAFVVVFGAIGLLKTTPERTKYRGEATVMVYEETKPLVCSMFKQLDLYCASPLFAANLNLPDSLQKKIRKIEIFNWIDSKNDGTPDFVDFSNSKKYNTDTTNVVMGDRLYLRITTKGCYDMAAVQAWLQRYFDAQTSLSEQVAQARKSQQMRLDAVNHEIVRLDSLANFEYFESKKSNARIDGAMLILKDKQLYHDDILKQIEQRDRIEAALGRRLHNISFQNDMTIDTAHSRLFYLFFWVLVGYILGVLVALGVVYRRQIRDYMKQK